MLFAVFASNLCAIFALLTEHIFRKLNRNDLAFFSANILVSKCKKEHQFVW